MSDGGDPTHNFLQQSSSRYAKLPPPPPMAAEDIQDAPPPYPPPKIQLDALPPDHTSLGPSQSSQPATGLSPLTNRLADLSLSPPPSPSYAQPSSSGQVPPSPTISEGKQKKLSPLQDLLVSEKTYYACLHGTIKACYIFVPDGACTCLRPARERVLRKSQLLGQSQIYHRESLIRCFVLSNHCQKQIDLSSIV